MASALYDGQALLVGRTLDAAPAHIRAEYLPRLVRGEVVGSFATSEPDASTDLSADAMRTTATRVSGGYRLNGRKRWITNSCAADIMTTLCVVGGEHAMLLVDMHTDAVVVGEPDKKMGNRLQLTSDVEFTDVFVPDDHVIAEPGRGVGRRAEEPLVWPNGRQRNGCLAWPSARSTTPQPTCVRGVPLAPSLAHFSTGNSGWPSTPSLCRSCRLAVPEGGAQVRHPRLG